MQLRHPAAHGRQADALQVRREERGLRRPATRRPSCPSRCSRTTARACTPTSRSGTAASRCSPATATPGFSDIGRWYIGGLLSTRRPSSASPLRPPTPTSGWCPGYEAPVNLVYSQRNRSAACRIPLYSKSPKAKRVEFRCPDPSCNPYLAFAASSWPGSTASLNKIEPPEPRRQMDLFDLPPEELAAIAAHPRLAGGGPRRPRGRPGLPEGRRGVHRRPHRHLDRLQAQVEEADQSGSVPTLGVRALLRHLIPAGTASRRPAGASPVPGRAPSGAVRLVACTCGWRPPSSTRSSGDLEGNVERIVAALRRGRGRRRRPVRLPRAGRHRLPARGPAAQAGLRGATTWRRWRRWRRPAGRLRGRGRFVEPVDRPAADGPVDGACQAARPRGPAGQRRRGVRRGPRASASTTSACCPTTASSTSSAGSCPGDGPLAALRGRRRPVGVSICEDVWVADGPGGRPRAGPAPSWWSTSTPRPTRGPAGRAPGHAGRAGRRGRAAPIVYVNQVGGQDELVFDGASLVVRPTAPCWPPARQFEEDLLVVDLPCLDRAGAPASRRCVEVTVRLGRPADRRAVLAAAASPEPLGADGRGLRGAGAGHARLPGEERLRRRGGRALRAASTRRWWPRSPSTPSGRTA